MRVLVTGGAGFLGSEILEQGRQRGWELRSISRGAYPELESRGVTCFQADLGLAGVPGPAGQAASDELERAVEGCDAILHTAAKAGIWGPRHAFEAANIDATRNVVEAALRAGVPRLVHTSSPSVCFRGEDELNASNDLPLAEEFLAHYPETKAAAERLALGANGSAMAVCVLRPHLIFGPRDPHLLPRLVERGRKRRLRRVGRGYNEVTLCYVDNAAHAHLLAAESLTPDAPHAGQAYFIGQEQPVVLWEWIDELFAALEIAPIRRSISYDAAWRLGAVMETLWRILPLGGEPPMTRFVAAQLATSHSYDMQPAQRDFGYQERVGLDEAMARSVAWLRE